MDRNTLRWLLQKMEKEAQTALAKDGSFLEALQALKWEVDRDARVRDAARALRDRGLSAYSSFVPRIRIRLHAGETVLALPKDSASSVSPDTEDLDRSTQIGNEALAQELRDAAGAVVAASLYCRSLEAIVNEAVQANAAFERIAKAVELAGYEVQICLDLSTYAQVREQSSTTALFPGYRVSRAGTRQPKPLNSEEHAHLPLSGRDMQFLKELRIRPE
jgi:hypothetical protein